MSMKALYLVFGLLLLASVSSAPSTPFLVDGYIQYSNGDPVNNPEVNLTNLNTGKVFTAEISTDYYQLIPVNISQGDVIRFNVTDGVTYNITNHTVTANDLNNGGIFDFTLILLSTSPGITDFSPDSPVHDVENATRTFSITTDQVVNVTWLINGTEVQANKSTTDASYTNTTAAAGIWNVSAMASNENGTTMQTWTWDVAMLPEPNITSFTQPSSVNDVENATRTFSITIDQVVNVTWLINGIDVQSNKSTNEASYTNTTAAAGIWNVSAMASNENGTTMQTWTWDVAMLPEPNITSFTQPSSVNDVENATRTFSITIDQVVNVTWLINGIDVQANKSTTDASYTNTSAIAGIWNVSAIASNENGTTMQTWEWNIASSGTANSTAPFMIYGWVYYDNGSECMYPVVNISNLNISTGWQAQTLDASYYYQLVLDTVNIRAGDEIRINASKDGAVWSANHTIGKDDIDNGIIEVNINEDGVLPDLTVTQIYLPPEWLIANSSNTITAEIKNDGTAITEFNVSLTANGDLIDIITVTSMATGASESVCFNWVPDIDGNYLLMVEADSDNKIEESNETNNNFSKIACVGAPDISVTEIYYYPSSPVNDSDPVNITAIIENRGSKGAWVNIDFYIVEKTPWGDPSYVNVDPFASNSVYIKANGTNITSAIWHATCGMFDSIYEIKVVADDNSSTTDLTVIPSRDFTVVDIIPGSPTAIFGDNVTLNITLENLGIRTGDAEIDVSVDNGGDGELIYSSSRTLKPGIPDYIVFDWDTGSTNLGGECNISVMIDPYKKTSEINETNNEMTHSIFVNGTDLVVAEVLLLTEQEILYLYGKEDLFDVTATIENRGAIPSNNFTIWFDHNGLSHRINITSLAANETRTVNTVWNLSNATSGDEQILVVRIDNSNDPENNLTNNVKEFSGEFESPWDITDIIFIPEYPKEGGDVKVTANIENMGSRTGTADVRFYSNGHEFGREDVYVGANATADVSVILKDVKALLLKPDEIKSKYDIRVFEARDPDNTGYEKSMSIDIPENLTVRMNVDPPEPEYNETANVHINITNNGDEVANTTLWFYDVDNTYYNMGSEGKVTLDWYPGASNMSICFDNAALKKDTGYCKVSDKDYRLIYDPPASHSGSAHLTTDWIIWGSGDIIRIEYKDICKILGHLPGPRFMSAALLNTTPITLDPGESVNLTIPWYVPLGGHMLWAQVSSESDHKLVNSLTPDITVTLSVDNDVVDDGDVLNVTATLKNIGSPDVTDFEIRFFNDSNEFNVTEIPGSAVSGNNVTNVTVRWEANTWNASKGTATLNHTIHARIYPCGNIDADESNDHDATVVRVNPTRDFSITDITSFQDEKTEQITINATLNNFGKAGSTNISICVNNSDEHLQIYSAAHWVDFASYLNVIWEANMVGNCSINITADPDNRILEINESNNSLTIPVYIEAPDLTVKSLVIDPSDLIEGNTTNITATIANIGDRDANNVTIAFYDRGNHIQSGDWRLGEGNPEVTLNQPDAAGIRVHFKKLELPGAASINIYDENGNPVTIMGITASNMWTQWIPGSSVNIEMDCPSISFAEIDRYEYHKIFNKTSLSLEANTSKDIQTKWTAYPSGPHEISMIVDPEDAIIELNETNNEQTRINVVQGPDINVDLTLDNMNPVEGDIINITGFIKNIGVLPANDFTVRIDIDNICITESVNISLLRNETLNISTAWTAIMGDHTIQVTADPDEILFETSEENNVVSINVFVNAPDLNVTNIEFYPQNLTDGDESWINATITNQGFQEANNFSLDIFYEYSEFEGSLKPFEIYHAAGGNQWGETWVNLTWENKTMDAGCIYIHIEEISGNPLLCVYDRNNTIVTNSTTSEWIVVMGNAANISVYAGVHAGNWNSMKMRFYAGSMTRFNNLSLDVDESATLGMRQEVSTGRHNIRVFADIESHINETNKENNIRTETINVQPSRDFSISNVSISANGYEVGVNNTIKDGDPVIVSATIENTGFRKGIVDVDIIDEHDWVDASPRYEATSYGYARVISYPGADAIRVHFKELDVSPRDAVEIRDENGTLLCTISSNTRTSPWVDGDEIYLYKVRKPTAYGIYRYIACDIDKYQYRIVNRTTVEIAANGTAHIPARFTPGAGDHTIRVIADPDDKIGEIIESNNEANKTIYVEPCRDPAVVDIMFDTQMPDPGDAVNLTATVTNHGNRTATFTVDLYATKFEYRPFESPHPDTNSPIFSVFETDVTTYPEANRTGVHFTRISTDIDPVTHDDETYLQIYDKDGKISEDYYGLYEKEDVWAWVADDLLKIKTELFCTGGGGCIWGYEIDTVAHIVTLNKTTVTLQPGETANVTGILPNVRIGNRSISYTITAVVDQDNTVFETNELNNMISKELIANCPDLTVREYLSFTSSKTSAVIKNIGTGKAQDANVRFIRDTDIPGNEKYGMKISTPADEDDINAIRVHFKELHINGDDSLRIRRCAYCGILQKYTSGDYYDTWSNWVSGDYFRIYYDRGVDAEVDRYEYAKDVTVGDIPGDDIKKKEIPWFEYEAPYNLTVEVDPGNAVVESNEDNNNVTIKMGADIAVRWIYVDPYAPIMGDTCYIKGIKNIGNLPTGEFNLTISINATDEIAFEHNTTINETISLAPYEEYAFPWDSPEIEPPDDIDYEIRIVVDPEDVVKELNEDNNKASTSEPVTVYSHTNYSGGKLYLYDTDWVYGNINYMIGDSTYKGGWTDYKVNFEDVIPENINEKDIKLARLYLYWTWAKAYSINESKFVPVPIEVNLKFNDITISEDRRYLDYPHATDFDVAWGTYTYKIPSDAVKSDNSVVVDKSLFRNKYESDPYYHYPYPFGIFGVGLLVVYEDDDGVLTNYWINEGGDVIFEGANALGIEDMVTTAVFKGKVEDEDMANATLWTVVPSGYDDENELHFNGVIWEDVWDDNIAIDRRCVTKHLIAKDNKAELQYISGGSMMSSGAFLFVRYPPDLAVTDIEAPVSAVVGNKYVINTTISNEGTSDATHFNVSFYSNNVRVGRQKLSHLDSGDNITLHFNWKPMHMGKIYKLKVAADVVSGPDWVELDVDNNVMTKNVPIVEGGFGNESGPLGEGGSGAGGSGDGEGLSLFDVITGILMKGTVLKDGSGGGGGGIGEFSMLEWLMKGLILTTCSFLVYFGYSMEKRRYNKR